MEKALDLTYATVYAGEDVIEKGIVMRGVEKLFGFKNNTIWAPYLDHVAGGERVFSKERRGCYLLAKEGRQIVGSLCVCNLAYLLADEKGHSHDHPAAVFELASGRDDIACFGDLVVLHELDPDSIGKELVRRLESFAASHGYTKVYLHVHPDQAGAPAYDWPAFWSRRGYQAFCEEEGVRHFSKVLKNEALVANGEIADAAR